MRYQTGDLRLIVDEVGADIMHSDVGGQKVYDHIHESFRHIEEHDLPKAWSDAIYVLSGRQTAERRVSP